MKISQEHTTRRLMGAERAKLIAAAGNRCQSCGATDVPLHVVSIVPLREGGDLAGDNLGVLCPNCHARLRSTSPSEMEFVSFLATLLREHPDYDDVAVQPVFRNQGQSLSPDFVARRRSRRVLVEAKRAAFMRTQDVQSVADQLDKYRAAVKPHATAVAFPGRVSQASRRLLEARNIEVWDLDHIAATFGPQIAKTRHPGFRLLFAMARPATDGQTDAQALIDRLKACRPGRDEWLEGCGSRIDHGGRVKRGGGTSG